MIWKSDIVLSEEIFFKIRDFSLNQMLVIATSRQKITSSSQSCFYLILKSSDSPLLMTSGRAEPSQQASLGAHGSACMEAVAR